MKFIFEGLLREDEFGKQFEFSDTKPNPLRRFWILYADDDGGLSAYLMVSDTDDGDFGAEIQMPECVAVEMNVTRLAKCAETESREAVE